MTNLKDFHENLERMNNAQSKINIQNNIDNFAIQFAEWYYCANNNEYWSTVILFLFNFIILILLLIFIHIFFI